MRSLAVSLLTFWLASSLVFCLLHVLPGDAISTQFAQSGATEADIQQRRAAVGLDQPLFQQYINFWTSLARGDLGQSLYGGETVNQIVRRGLASTFPLASLSLLIAIGLGILLGGASALSQTKLARAAALLTDLAIGVPVYWTATVALYILAARFGAAQTGLVLPVIVLGFHTAGAIAQVTSIALLEARNKQHVRTAHAKGLPQRRVLSQHIMRNSLPLILPVIALQSGALFSGTVLTEIIFQRAGLGLLLVEAVLARNYPVVQGIVVVITFVYIIANSLATWLSGLFDPRLRSA